MKTQPTFKADIYIGLREGYGHNVMPLQTAHTICQTYCDDVKLGITFTPTEFIYVDGYEPGVIIGLINYPRFPSEPIEIKKRAISLAKILMKELKQERCSIVCSDETIMLERKSK